MGYTQDKIAEKLDRSQPWVSQVLRWRRDGYKSVAFGPDTRSEPKPKLLALANNSKPVSFQLATNEKGEVERTDDSQPLVQANYANGESKIATAGLLEKGEPVTVKPKATGSSAPSVDAALMEFTSHVSRLVQITKGAKTSRFVKTGVKSENLHELSKFLALVAIAQEKNAEMSKGNGGDPAEMAKARMAENAAKEKETA